jgi:hypothetical protein
LFLSQRNIEFINRILPTALKITVIVSILTLFNFKFQDCFNGRPSGSARDDIAYVSVITFLIPDLNFFHRPTLRFPCVGDAGMELSTFASSALVATL